MPQAELHGTEDGEDARHHGEGPGPAGWRLRETGEQPGTEGSRQGGQQDEGEQPRRSRGGACHRFGHGVREGRWGGAVRAVAGHPGVHLFRQREDVPVPEVGGGTVRHPVGFQCGGDLQRVDGAGAEFAVAVHERLDRVSAGRGCCAGAAAS